MSGNLMDGNKPKIIKDGVLYYHSPPSRGTVNVADCVEFLALAIGVDVSIGTAEMKPSQATPTKRCPVMVVCLDGLSASAVALAALYVSWKNLSVTTALALVVNKKPTVTVTKDHFKALYEYAERLEKERARCSTAKMLHGVAQSASNSTCP